MNKILALLFLVFSSNVFAQSDTIAVADTTYWRRSFQAGANINQGSFSSNWKGGGISSIALSTFLKARADFKRDRVSWDNMADLQYGIVKNSGQDLRKNVDIILLDSKFGYSLSKNWNSFISGNFLTQFGPGYNYDAGVDESDLLISGFMAPGFLTLGLGMEFKPQPWFSLRLSPFAPRFTFLLNDNVGLNERYGVDPGSRVRTEWFAAMLQSDIDLNLTDNVNLKVNYQAFANYETLSLRRLDHRLITTVTAKVTNLISVNLTGILIYDYDQDLSVQYSQALGLGILYRVQNFRD